MSKEADRNEAHQQEAVANRRPRSQEEAETREQVPTTRGRCNKGPLQQEADGSFLSEAGSGETKKELGRLGGTAEKVTLARTNNRSTAPAAASFLVTLPLA